MQLTLRLRAGYTPVPEDAASAAARAYPFMDRLGQRVKANARERANVRTGRMRDSIDYRVTATGATVTTTVFANTPYARFVHEGTRPHAIYPKHARCLVFFWPKVGRTVFRKRVWHPGYAGNPFLWDAAVEEVGRGVAGD